MFAITLGVGIGLVFSSGVALILQPDDTSKVSEDFIKSEAKKLGMIEPSEYIDKKQIQSENTSSDSQNTIIVEIPDGANEKEVANILKEKNLIESEEAFIQKINEINVHKNFKAGTFEFTDSDSIEDIIHKIIIKD